MDLLEYLLHHHVHSCQLRPDLGKNANMCTVDHIGLEKIQVCDICITAFLLNRRLDLAEFELNNRSVAVALGVYQSENIMCLFPAIVLGKPSGGLLLLVLLWSWAGRHTSGTKRRPMNKQIAGIICRPHGILKAAVPFMKEHP